MANDNNNLLEKTLSDIREIRLSITKGVVPLALIRTWMLNEVYSNYKLQERLSAIDHEFKMMKKYWIQGADDDQRSSLLSKISTDLDDLLCDLEMERLKTNLPFFKDCRRRIATSGEDFTLTEVKARLEAFVSDFTMTELLPDDQRPDKLKQLHAKHQRYLDIMFDYILCIGDMTRLEAKAWTDILVSPTIDTADRQLLIAALLINLQEVPQRSKMRCMLDIYLHAEDDNSRQPALVGWVLALHLSPFTLDEKMYAEVRDILNDPDKIVDLQSLQMQILITMNAEQDSHIMDMEINKVRLSNEYRKITDELKGKGEDHTLDDVLNAGENNKQMDEWMESISKISDMRKKGADIFFGSFSQLKNIGFFSKPSNWFVNFYIEHPDIDSSVNSNPSIANFLKVFTAMPLLSTDKYSFVMISARMINRLPQDIIAKAFDDFPNHKEIPNYEEDIKGMSIRDAFVKLLYRFFKLFGQRECFHNPMDTPRTQTKEGAYLFMAHPICQDTLLDTGLLSFCKTMYKLGHKSEIFHICNTWKNISKTKPTIDDGFDFLYFWGAYCYEMHLATQGDTNQFRYDFNTNAIQALTLAHELNPDNLTVSTRLMRALFHSKDYGRLMELAEELSIADSIDEEKLGMYATTLIAVHREEEAERVMYKLLYIYPDSPAVISNMPALLLLEGKFDQAEKLVKGWLDKGLAKDFVELYQYMGICQYRKSNMADAVEYFSLYFFYSKHQLDYYKSDDLHLEIETIVKKNLSEKHEANPLVTTLLEGCIVDRIEELKAQKKMSEERG